MGENPRWSTSRESQKPVQQVAHTQQQTEQVKMQQM
jgi:hypothetical protein